MAHLETVLEARLQQRREAHLYRWRRCLEGPQSPEIQVDGRSLLGFCSNDYLGLAAHPRVVAAFREAAAHYGVGSGASHLVNGHSRLHQQLEEALADWTGRPRALLFSTGYMANLGTVTALVGRGDALFEDRLNHASLLDAGVLSGARFRRYAHKDAAALERLLSRSSAQHRLVVTDGVFSMDGDAADLDSLGELCARQGAWLMVDDAHGLGVLGNQGGGVLEDQAPGLAQVPILMGTLGKALGAFGAFVAGSEALIETLIQFARPYIYTTALPPAVAAAALASLELLRLEPERRTQLHSLVRRFREGAAQLPWPLLASATPIQPLLVGDSARALALSEALEARGLLVTAIRPPTVPVGAARLRVTLSASHTEAQVDRLLEALGEVAREPS